MSGVQIPLRPYNLTRSKPLSESDLLRIIRNCDDDTPEDVVNENINEMSGVSKAAHGGEIVIEYN